MPATYAHYRFGLDVLNSLPNGFHKKMIQANKLNYDLFMIGLHGPDILFFYKPYQKNIVNQTGFRLHATAAKEFFQKALLILESQKSKRSFQASYSYLCGVVCHFALDHGCHPYIYSITDQKRFLHSEIETEFDRMLLLEDHIMPYGRELMGHIHNSPFKAQIIAQFYSLIPPRLMLQAVHSFEYYNNLLCSHGIRRKLFEGLLTISGNRYTQKMMIAAKPDHRLDAICQHLRNLYKESIPTAVGLIQELEKNRTDTLSLNPLYDFNFGRGH